MSDRIRVLLADNHRLCHDGIHAALAAAEDLAPVGEAATGREALALCRQQRPHVLLLAPNVGDSTVADMLRYVRARCPETKVLMLLAEADETSAQTLLDHGAAGCVLKSETTEGLLRAIRAVARGERWLSRPHYEAMLAHQAGRTRANGLTDRELAILRLVAAEMTDREIAGELQIGERTVRYHLQDIFQKLGVESRVGAAVQAVRLRLIP